jgi:SynChlorMet cassette radical SAM/SPASM protein ScmF
VKTRLWLYPLKKIIKLLVNTMADRKIELPEGVPLLSTYYLYLTGGCNLACQHCWITPTFQAHGGTGGHLDYDLLALAIEEGLPLGLNSVKLTGGEPLLHPDFVKIVDLLYEKNLSVNIETNGTRMTADLALHLKEKKVNFISISLDGAIAETHDAFRGVKGCFDQAVQGIRYLVEAGYHPQVIMSLHDGNLNEIEALVHLAESLGAGSVKFNIIQPSGRGEIFIKRGRSLDIKKLIDIGKWVESDLQKRTFISLHYSWPIAFFSLSRLLNGGLGACGIFNILGILSNGSLAMCGIGMESPDLCYGTAGSDKIVNVWSEHPTLLALRTNLVSELDGICKNCVFTKQCLGNCVAENYHQSKKLTSAYWFCESAEQAGLFPISRLQQVEDND